jgi:hypothetical protein
LGTTGYTYSKPAGGQAINSAKIKLCPTVEDCDCSNLKAGVSENPTGVENMRADKAISLYPNPTTLIYRRFQRECIL